MFGKIPPSSNGGEYRRRCRGSGGRLKKRDARVLSRSAERPVGRPLHYRERVAHARMITEQGGAEPDELDELDEIAARAASIALSVLAGAAGEGPRRLRAAAPCSCSCAGPLNEVLIRSSVRGDGHPEVTIINGSRPDPRRWRGRSPLLVSSAARAARRLSSWSRRAGPDTLPFQKKGNDPSAGLSDALTRAAISRSPTTSSGSRSH